MSIPLVQDNSKDAINTSLNAIKRNLDRINSLLGLVDNQLEDLSSFATKEELQNAVTSLQPVDTVASGNLHSVTSNAVAQFNETVSATITKVPNVLNGNKFYASRSANVVQITLDCDSGSNIQSGVITKVATVSPKPKMFTEFSCQCDLVLINGMYVQPYQRMFLNTDGDLYIFVVTPDGQPYTANVFSGGCYLV